MAARISTRVHIPAMVAHPFKAGAKPSIGQLRSSSTNSGPKKWSATAYQIFEKSRIGALAGRYTRFQAKRPYTAQVSSILVIWLCGDLSAQLLFPPKREQDAKESQVGVETLKSSIVPAFDPWRTTRHLTVGVVASIPTYKWFMLLQNSFKFKSRTLSVLTRVFVHQLVFTPIFNIYFFGMQSLLSGDSFEKTLERLRKTLLTSTINAVKVWTGVSLISFTFIPPQFQNIFSGFVAIGWQAYLSQLNQRASVALKTEDFEESEGYIATL